MIPEGIEIVILSISFDVTNHNIVPYLRILEVYKSSNKCYIRKYDKYNIKIMTG